MYSFFLIFSIYRLLKDKYVSSFILFGIALSFKLQAVFLIPFFILDYLKERKYSFLMFLIPILVLLASGLPGVVFGRSVFDPINIYLNQTTACPEISLNFNSFWNISIGPFDVIKELCIGTAIIALGFAMYSVLKNKLIYVLDNKIYFATLLVWTSILFLPSIHDRYDYFLLVLLVIQIVINIKFIVSAVISCCLSQMVYSNFLFWYDGGKPTIYTAFLAIFAYALYVINGVKEYKIKE